MESADRTEIASPLDHYHSGVVLFGGISDFHLAEEQVGGEHEV
jgi:hypothetical protein